MRNYVTKKDLSKANEAMDKLEKAYDKLDSIDTMTSMIDNVKSELESSILNRVKKIDFESKLKSYNNRYNNINSEIKLMQSKISDMVNDVRTSRSMIMNRVTIADFSYAKNDIINTHAKKDDLISTRSQIFPEIERFKKKIEEFEVSNIQNKDIINRFDEVICGKASKGELSNLKNSLSNYVDKTEFEAVHKFKDSVIEDLDLMYLRICDIHKEMGVTIEQIVSKSALEVHRKILNSLGGRPVDVDELKQCMDLKVDKIEFGKSNSLKADRTDFKGIISSLELMQKQLQNVASVLLDHFGSMISEGFNTKLG